MHSTVQYMHTQYSTVHAHTVQYSTCTHSTVQYMYTQDNTVHVHTQYSTVYPKHTHTPYLRLLLQTALQLSSHCLFPRITPSQSDQYSGHGGCTGEVRLLQVEGSSRAEVFNGPQPRATLSYCAFALGDLTGLVRSL